jgi:hypothetical protein
MKQVILDTSVVLRAPELLSRSVPDVRLVLPEAVYGDLMAFTTRGGTAQYNDLLDQSLAAGLITQQPFDELVTNTRDRDRRPRYPSDAEILATAVAYLKRYPDDEVILATEDRLLMKSAHALGGIKTIDGGGLRELLSSGPVNAAIDKHAGLLRRYERKHLIVSAILGASTTALLALIYFNLSFFLTTLNVWGTALLAIVLAFVLFWFRSRRRVAYGVGEVGAGLLTILSTFLPTLDYPRLHPLSLLQILGGLYVMVRGLDNIGKGLSRTRFGPRWGTWFPE